MYFLLLTTLSIADDIGSLNPIYGLLSNLEVAFGPLAST